MCARCWYMIILSIWNWVFRNIWWKPSLFQLALLWYKFVFFSLLHPYLIKKKKIKKKQYGLSYHLTIVTAIYFSYFFFIEKYHLNFNFKSKQKIISSVKNGVVCCDWMHFDAGVNVSLDWTLFHCFWVLFKRTCKKI